MREICVRQMEVGRVTEHGCVRVWENSWWDMDENMARKGAILCNSTLFCSLPGEAVLDRKCACFYTINRFCRLLYLKEKLQAGVNRCFTYKDFLVSMKPADPLIELYLRFAFSLLAHYFLCPAEANKSQCAHPCYIWAGGGVLYLTVGFAGAGSLWHCWQSLLSLLWVTIDTGLTDIHMRTHTQVYSTFAWRPLEHCWWLRAMLG